MKRPTLIGIVGGAFACVLALTSSAAAQHGVTAPAPAKSTDNLQGNGADRWINDPHMHAFYDTTVAAFAQGPTKVDVAGYEQKSYAIFRTFGLTMGVTPEAMQDHLKLIPRQVVKIVREDAHVLDNYKNFVDATFGPQ